MSAVISRFGGDISKIGCSREIVRKRWIKDRTDLLSTIKKNYHSESILMIHWDGKLIKSLHSHKKFDRLAVLMTEDCEKQILGVPELSFSTDQAQADAVFELLNEWKLADKITGMCTGM